MKSDIAFITRPSTFVYKLIPYAELVLSSYLEHQGLKSTVIDAHPYLETSRKIHDQERIEKYYKYIKAEIYKERPKYIGIGAFTSDYDFVMELAKKIKSYYDCKIIVGNCHASLYPKDFIFKNSPIDFAVIGEGELTLTELLRCNNQSIENLKKIDGLCFYDKKSGQAIITNQREIMKDISIPPILDYEKLDMDFYTSPTKGIISYIYFSLAALFTGRGCPYQCEFCAANTIWRKNKNGFGSVRYRPIDDIVNEIKSLKNNYKIDAFFILDDTFTLRKERAFEFCEKIKPLKIVWASQTRVDLVTDELVKKMKDAGCIQIDFGIESGSQRMLDLMRKGFKVEEVIKTFEICKKYKMRTVGNMLFNLPKEKEEDIEMSLNLWQKIKPDEVRVGLTVPYPGTAIYEKYFPLKLTKDEYYLLEEARGYGKGKFRLSDHGLDFDNLLVRFRTDIQYQHLIPGWIRILANKNYLKVIIKSGHRLQYLFSFVREMPVALVRITGSLFLSLMPRKYRPNLVNLATKYGKIYGN